MEMLTPQHVLEDIRTKLTPFVESSNCAQMASRFLELFAFQQFLKSEKFIPGRILLAYLMVVLMYELNQEKNYKSQFTFTSLYEVNMRVRTRIIIGINSV